MTIVNVRSGGLVLEFPGWESAMVRRSTMHVPAEAVLDATAAPGWTSEVLGIRSGLVISGYRKLGTFTHFSGMRRLVSMKRGVPLLRVAVDRGLTGFDELLLSTSEAEQISRGLRSTEPA